MAYKPNWLKTDIDKDYKEANWNYEGYKQGNNKVDLTPPPFVNPVEARRNLNFKPADEGMDLTPIDIKKISKEKDYTIDEWNNLGPFAKIKVGIEQKKLGNYDYAPREDLYKQEVNKQANSKLGAGIAGFANAASLGSLEAGAKAQTKDFALPNVFTEAEMQSPVSYNVGKIAGYVAPSLVGANLARPVTSLIKKPLAKQVAEGAIVGSAMTGIEDAFQGKSLKETGKDMALNAALGAGIDLGVNALGKVAKSAFPKWKTTFDSTVPNEKPNTNIKPSNSFSKPSKLQASTNIPDANIKPVRSVIDTPRSVNNEVASTVQGKTKNRQFIENSVINSEIATPEMKAKFTKNMPEYEPITNMATWENATSRVDSDFNKSLDSYWSNGDLKSADDTALGEALISRAINKGDIELANKLSSDLAEKLTRAGQTVQAAAMFKRLSPEGMLMYTQNVVKRVNKDLVKEFGAKANKVELTAEESQKILDLMKKVKDMADGDDKNTELAKVMRIVNSKVPTQLADKIRAYRNIALLGNAKTFTRNIVGNALMGAFDNVSNTIGATLLKPLDNALAKKTGMKTVSMPSVFKQAQGFAKGGKVAVKDSLGGLSKQELKTELSSLKGKSIKEKYNSLMDIFTNPIDSEIVSNGKFEAGKGLAFKNKPMRLLENAVNTSLAIGDKPFSTAYFDDVINQLKKANKTDTVTNEMKEIAEKVAKERTYQDMNTISNLASMIKRLPSAAANNPKLEKTIKIYVDTILPYTKTPASILKRGLESTPIGIIEGLAKLGSAFKSGNLTAIQQREIIDRLSRGIAGTGLLGGGAALAKAGKITGAANKDKDVAAFEKQTGKQPYAFKIGDKYYNYDWMQPVSMPLGAAAQAVNAKKEGSDNLTALADAVSNALNYYTDQPMLQSMQRLLGSTYDSKGIGQRVLESTLELPKQLVPSVLKQATQLNDDVQRNTYSTNYIENTLINPIKSKIPGQSNKLEPKIDIFGNEVKQFQGKNNLFNVAVNPGYLTKDMSNKVTDMIMDTYKETGDKTIFPRVAPKSFTYKNNPINLTPKELTEFQQYIGKRTTDYFEYKADSKEFSNKSPEEKAKELQKVLDTVYNEGKKKILEQRGIK